MTQLNRGSRHMKKILSFIIKSANLWIIMNIVIKLPLLGAALDGMKSHTFNDDSVTSTQEIGGGNNYLAQGSEECPVECEGECECECECDC